MKIKLLVVFLGLALVTLPLFSPYAKPARAEAFKLKAIACWPFDHEINKWYFEFIDRVNKKANGELVIEWLGGPEVVGAREQFEGLRSGIADMTNASVSYFSGETLAGNALNTIRPEADYLRKVWRESGIMDVINEAYREKSGVRVVGNFGTGRGFTIMSAKPVINGSLSGLKIRTFGIQLASAVVTLGGSPQSLPSSERFPAMQRGVIDGCVICPCDAKDYGEFGVYKYIVLPPVTVDNTLCYISTRKWDQLPGKLKEILNEVAEEVEKESFPYNLQWRLDSTEWYVKNEGLQIITLTAEEEKRWAKAFRKDFLDVLTKKDPKYGPKLEKILGSHWR